MVVLTGTVEYISVESDLTYREMRTCVLIRNLRPEQDNLSRPEFLHTITPISSMSSEGNELPGDCLALNVLKKQHLRWFTILHIWNDQILYLKPHEEWLLCEPSWNH